MPTDTAPFDVTDPAIAQVPRGHFLLVDVLSVLGNHDPVAWKYRHVGDYLLNDVLPPKHGLI